MCRWCHAFGQLDRHGHRMTRDDEALGLHMRARAHRTANCPSVFNPDSHHWWFNEPVALRTARRLQRVWREAFEALLLRCVAATEARVALCLGAALPQELRPRLGAFLGTVVDARRPARSRRELIRCARPNLLPSLRGWLHEGDSVAAAEMYRALVLATAPGLGHV